MLLKIEMICKQPLAEGRELNFVQIRDISIRIPGMHQGWQERAAIPVSAPGQPHCLSTKCSAKTEIWQEKCSAEGAAVAIH